MRVVLAGAGASIRNRWRRSRAWPFLSGPGVGESSFVPDGTTCGRGVGVHLTPGVAGLFSGRTLAGLPETRNSAHRTGWFGASAVDDGGIRHGVRIAGHLLLQLSPPTGCRHRARGILALHPLA